MVSELRSTPHKLYYMLALTLSQNLDIKNKSYLKADDKNPSNICVSEIRQKIKTIRLCKLKNEIPM